MLFNIPIAIWLGIITFISLFITFSFGIAMHHFKKNVFRYHKFFAFFTVSVAVAHVIFAILLWFFGIVV
jgi:hypothetical protein